MAARVQLWRCHWHILLYISQTLRVPIIVVFGNYLSEQYKTLKMFYIYLYFYHFCGSSCLYVDPCFCPVSYSYHMKTLLKHILSYRFPAFFSFLIFCSLDLICSVCVCVFSLVIFFGVLQTSWKCDLITFGFFLILRKTSRLLPGF